MEWVTFVPERLIGCNLLIFRPRNWFGSGRSFRLREWNFLVLL